MKKVNYNLYQAEKLKEEQKRIEELALKLLNAFIRTGEVQAIDGIVYENNTLKQLSSLMDTTDMYTVVRYLATLGLYIRRVDAGGRPTWRIE